MDIRLNIHKNTFYLSLPPDKKYTYTTKTLFCIIENNSKINTAFHQKWEWGCLQDKKHLSNCF